jgi:hypothetical protein
MKFRDYINEGSSFTVNYSQEDRGKTTKDKGHSHTYFFKRMTGDGGTSKDSGHLHKIKAMVILKADGHDHDMR